MKQNKIKYVIYLTYQLLFLIKLAYQYNTNIYTPYYLNRIDFSEKSTFPLLIMTNQYTTNVYISLGVNGIMIMDTSGKNIIFQQNLDNNFISCFDVAQNGKYIIAGVLQKIIIYENIASNPNEYFFKQISQVDFSSLIFSISYHQSKQILIVAGGNGDVIVYDGQDLKNIKQKDLYVSGADAVYNIQISTNGEWIYLSCNFIGTVVLQLFEKEIAKIQEDGNLKNREIKLELAAIGQITNLSQYITATSDNEYLYTIDTFYGFYFSKCKDMLNRKEKDKPIQLTFKRYWPFTLRSPWSTMITISSDDKYIFIASRAQGIIIYDNSDRENIKLLQLIQIDTLVYTVAVSKNQQYLYLINSESIFTFAQSKLNLNDDYPNLFNTQHAVESAVDGWAKTSCLVYKDEEYLMGFFDYDGLNIIPYFKDPYKLKTSSMTIIWDDIVEVGSIHPSNKYLIIPRVLSKNLLGVYQIQPLDDSDEQKKISPLKPKLVYNFSLETSNISEGLTFSLDNKYAIATFEHGIFLLDTSNILNIKLLQTWENQLNIQGKSSAACFTRDTNWILYTIRLQGIYLLNAQNKTNLQLSDIVVTFGGEFIQMSQNSDLYAYVCDGIKGFAIIDLTKLPKISFLSRVSLQGKTIYMSMILENEQYALLTSYDDGVLSLVDMKDKKNPQIISTYGYQSIYGSGACGPKSNEYIFVTSTKGIITLPLKSQVNIHTEVFEVFTDQITGKERVEVLNKDENVQLFNQINGEYTFIVGQQIQFNFAFIYAKSDSYKIIGIKQYQDYNQYEIPSYMTYKSNSQTLLLKICKEQLDTQDRMKSNLNTILIKVSVPLLKTQFIYDQNNESDKSITTKEQSYKIFYYLKGRNLLDSYNLLVKNLDQSDQFLLENDFIKELIDPTSKLSQTELNQVVNQLSNKIKQTLLNSIYFNPLKYYVKNSLIIDFKNQTAFIQSPYAQSITVILTIHSSLGKFVNFNYLGVISSISQLQDQITIQGPLENVNKVLLQRILFANSSIIDNQLKNNTLNSIDFEVIDNLNFRISQKTLLIESKYIQFKEHILTNNVTNLQYQIDKQFPERTIYIETDISFTFSEDSFIATNSSKINYQVFYQIGENINIDKYQEISPNLWIQFSLDSLSFRGSVSFKYYGNQYNFKVIVSDGYTQTEDYFILKANGIPFLYVFNILLKVLGPLLAFLGLYSKRYVFYNMIFKKHVTFSDEIVYCNKIYKKQIILLGKTLQDSQMITRSLFSKINLLNDLHQNQVPSKMNTFEDKLHNQMKQKSKLQTQSDIQNEKHLIISNIENNACSQIQESGVENSKQNGFFPNKSLNFRENSKKFISQINQQKPHNPQTIIEKRYLLANGSISITSIIKDIFQLNLLNQLSNSSNYKRIQLYTTDLKNNNSRICQSIKGFAARYLLNLNKKSFFMYEYIKYYCKNYYCNQNDWYKEIINIEYPNQRTNDSNPTIFPQLEIRCEQFLKILLDIDIIKLENCVDIKSFDQIEQLSQIAQMNINLQLIKEVLFADAIGFCEKTPTGFLPSVGESIHLDTVDIKFILAYKKKHYFKCIEHIISFLNLDYARYGVSKNMRLPGWICLDQKHGMICLEGIPESENVDEILIRIYDMTGYVIKQYQLKVIQQENGADNYDFIPDEQDYVQQQTQAPDNLKRGQYFMKHSRNNSYRLKSESFQLNDISAQQINYRSSFGSPYQSSPQSPNQFKLYEFQRQSNNKNQLTNDFQDTFEDLIQQRTNRNNNQEVSD